jgi:hypothetical protein
MNKLSWFVKASAVAALAAVIALSGFAGGSGSSVTAATEAPKPAIKLDEVCKAPPTPTPVPATKAAATPVATAAAPAATAAATKPAAAATAAATKPAEKPTATPKPPTQPPTPKPTDIPKGKQPAYAGFTLGLNKGLLRGGKPCIGIIALNAKGPAGVAGLKVGDVILGVDKEPVVELFTVADVITGKKSGDSIEITYQRDGKAAKAKIVLGLNPNVDPNATPAK